MAVRVTQFLADDAVGVDDNWVVTTRQDRARCVKRNVRYILCVLLNDEDATTTRRANTMRQASGIPINDFFLLVSNDNMKLEPVLNTLMKEIRSRAFGYYLETSRRIKKKRDTIKSPSDKIGIDVWTLRYDIKIAALAELMGILEESIKFYRSAYDGIALYLSSVATSDNLLFGSEKLSTYFSILESIAFKVQFTKSKVDLGNSNVY